MLGRTEDALANFREAEKMFQTTQDARGRVYTILGRGELLLMEGKQGRAGKLFQTGLETANEFGLQLEILHSELMIEIWRKEAGENLQFGKIREKYKEIGSDLVEEPGLPVNIP